MTQSRRMSLIEAVTNVAVGYALAVATQIVVFPWFGLHPSLGENLALGAWGYPWCAALRCAGCSRRSASGSFGAALRDGAVIAFT